MFSQGTAGQSVQAACRFAGGAQEDCDCLLAPPWQALFETKAADVLERL